MGARTYRGMFHRIAWLPYTAVAASGIVER
jgi:hypothetical protein